MKRLRPVTRGTGRGTAHLRNGCNSSHDRRSTVAFVQAVRLERWAWLLLTHWFRVRPPGAPRGIPHPDGNVSGTLRA